MQSSGKLKKKTHFSQEYNAPDKYALYANLNTEKKQGHEGTKVNITFGR